jgi:predicted  nucleic acid-binding Zn-ribbon protein
MTDLVLEHLKRIQSRLDNIEREITGLKAAVISSHEVMAAFLKNDVRREGDIFSLEQRIARIERRFDLSEAPPP